MGHFLLTTLALVALFLVAPSYASLYDKCRPISLENGLVRLRSRGRIVRFTCNPTFSLVGEKWGTCSRGRWDVTAPICVKPGCDWSAEQFIAGSILPLKEGALLKFACEPNLRLIGSQIIYCNGSSWNLQMPYCVSTGNINAYCDFEQAGGSVACGWRNSRNYADWRLRQGPTPSAQLGTGPKFDHTFGPSGQGHYMYLESSLMVKDQKAVLTSPVYPPMRTNVTCFIFWYHMLGKTVGSLNVYLNNDVVFSKTGNQGPNWMKGRIHNLPNSTSFQIVIEGSAGPGYAGDIAIDDLHFSDSIDCSTDKDFMSCEGRCNEDPSLYPRACHCHQDCHQFHACCHNYADVCTKESTTASSVGSSSGSEVHYFHTLFPPYEHSLSTELPDSGSKVGSVTSGANFTVGGPTGKPEIWTRTTFSPPPAVSATENIPHSRPNVTLQDRTSEDFRTTRPTETHPPNISVQPTAKPIPVIPPTNRTFLEMVTQTPFMSNVTLLYDPNILTNTQRNQGTTGQTPSIDLNVTLSTEALITNPKLTSLGPSSSVMISNHSLNLTIPESSPTLATNLTAQSNMTFQLLKSTVLAFTDRHDTTVEPIKPTLPVRPSVTTLEPNPTVTISVISNGTVLEPVKSNVTIHLPKPTVFTLTTRANVTLPSPELPPAKPNSTLVTIKPMMFTLSNRPTVFTKIRFSLPPPKFKGVPLPVGPNGTFIKPLPYPVTPRIPVWNPKFMMTSSHKTTVVSPRTSALQNPRPTTDSPSVNSTLLPQFTQSSTLSPAPVENGSTTKWRSKFIPKGRFKISAMASEDDSSGGSSPWLAVIVIVCCVLSSLAGVTVWWVRKRYQSLPYPRSGGNNSEGDGDILFLAADEVLDFSIPEMVSHNM